MRLSQDDGQILSSLIHIRKLTVPLTTPTVTTITADGEEDDDTLTFAKAGFTTGNWVLVDSGLKQSAYRLGTIPAGTEPIPITRPADFAHLEDAPVKRLLDLDLGYIEEGSATMSGSGSNQSVGAANARGRIWQSETDVGDLSISWGQRAASPENLLSMYGIDEGYVKGDGTPGNPFRALVHPDRMATQRDFAYLLRGYQKNMQVANLLILNPVPTVTVNSVFGAKNSPMVCTVGCLYTHKVWWVE